jgi:hypothetical protein
LKDLPFDTVGLSGDDVQILEDTYEAIKSKFNVGIDCNIHFDTKKFDLTANTETTVGGILAINTASPFYLVFLKTHYSDYGLRSVTRNDWYKYTVWAYINSKTDFGRVLIRHETFNDRLVGLFHPCEMKFPDDKAFDHKFYVVTNDDQKAHLAMNFSFRNAVVDMGDNLILETEGKSLIIGNQADITTDLTIQIAEFAAKISGLR